MSDATCSAALSAEVASIARLLFDLDADRIDALDKLEVLGRIAAIQRHLDDAAEWAVLDARDDEAPWDEIGAQLGTSRQAAHKRFGTLVHASTRTGSATKWREPKLPTR